MADSTCRGSQRRQQVIPRKRKIIKPTQVAGGFFLRNGPAATQGAIWEIRLKFMQILPMKNR
jgi:hypothetical protein